MVRRSIYATMFFVVLTSGVTGQFYDFFQALQPIVRPYPTISPITFDTSFTFKKQKSPSKHRTSNEQNNSNKENTRKNQAAHPSIDDSARKKEKTTAPPVYDFFFYTSTAKPARKSTKTSSSNRQANKDVSSQNHGSSKTISREIASSTRGNSNRENSKSNYNDVRNKQYHTTRPSYETAIKFNQQTATSNNRASNNRNSHTTDNPFYGTPGVKPALVDDRQPPITNKPPTRKPSYETYPKPANTDTIDFPTEDTSPPELMSGPDVDYMSDVDKRRYIELSEKMCDKYKNMNTKQVEAIPLVPSPQPIRINVTTCVPSNVPLVVGGKVVSIREFPHMALIGWLKVNTAGYAWRCGGSLISNQYVLTAAHCAYEERDNNVVMGPPRVVQLGSSYLDDPGAMVIKVQSAIRHPKYKHPKSYYDLALLKLSSSVTFSEVIKPACLGVPPETGASVIVTGWGKTEFGGKMSLELRSVSIHVWDMEECSDVLGKSRKLPDGPSSDSQMCAGERNGGKDTCQGDSGGPAQIQDGCVWRVVAVTSLGRSCGAPNTPALYAIAQRAFISSVVFGGQLTSNNNYGGVNNYQDNSHRSDNRRNINKYTTESMLVNNYNVYSSQKTSGHDSHNTPSSNNNQQRNYNDYNRQRNDNSYNYETYNSQPYYNNEPIW